MSRNSARREIDGSGTLRAITKIEFTTRSAVTTPGSPVSPSGRMKTQAARTSTDDKDNCQRRSRPKNGEIAGTGAGRETSGPVISVMSVIPDMVASDRTFSSTAARPAPA